jgi:hypothetical protein
MADVGIKTTQYNGQGQQLQPSSWLSLSLTWALVAVITVVNARELSELSFAYEFPQ